MIPEFSRRLPIQRIGEGMNMTIEADEAEREALAARMGIPAVLALTCRFHLHAAEGDTVLAEARLAARVAQICVVSLEGFESDISEDFRIRFVPAGTESDQLDLEEDDEVGYTGTQLELGEAAAEQLALCLPPFPRKPAVVVPADAADAPDTPFATLRGSRQ
jgi:uncharacterized metal-binding protein YceD (DUF177 family)